ncbi:MAG: gamma-glutamylcyclotransferase family protein [Alphaproteobacteria bacterium]
MGTVWYFAYGSNLQAATLRGRRGIDVLRSVPVRAPGWRLVFDKPGLIHPNAAVANIVPEDGAHVIGVAYEITADDHAHVELTEGVMIGSYRRVEVAVEPLDASVNAPPATALSLSSDKRAPGRLPSHRYLGLVVEGALEHGLPDDWVASLRAVVSREETDEERALRSVIDEALKRR